MGEPVRPGAVCAAMTAAHKSPAAPRVRTRAVLPLVPVPRTPRRLCVRIAMIGAAVVLIALGIVSLLVPVAPGFLFWIAGLLLLGVSVPVFGRWINRLDARLPPKWRRRLRPKLWHRGRRKLQKLR